MKEDLLHYVWRMQLFNRQELRTTCGQTIRVNTAGTLNTNAGPDFLNARLNIGGTEWAGNVEMHLRASDWLRHQHEQDRAYDNVILHVVLQEDCIIKGADGHRIPCLEMQRRIPRRLPVHYQRLLQNEQWIPCQAQFQQASSITKQAWLDRLAVERLEAKAQIIHNRLIANKGDWEKTFYECLARSFGGKVNADPMDALARAVPLNIIGKHRDRLFQIEALLFGQSGLLNEGLTDDYPQRLQKEYQFLAKKYQLRTLPGSTWKFLRMRPAGFPTIRIAQLAGLLYQSKHLLSKVLAAQDTTELENLFEVKLSNYWQYHYTFDVASKKRAKSLGRNTIHSIVVNTIAPFLFVYGQQKGADHFRERALDWLEALPAEDNRITRNWSELDMPAASALQSQALLQLKSQYCSRKRCLECAIGNNILQRTIAQEAQARYRASLSKVGSTEACIVSLTTKLDAAQEETLIPVQEVI